MRKKLIFFICLAVCLQTIAFAQMQGIITNSSERFSRAIQPEVNTIKDNTLHIINKNDIFSIDSTNPNSWDTTILYSIDVIHRLQVYPTITPYLSEIIIPSNNLEYDDYINSITKYTDNHYIVGGKSSNTSSIYWFDRRYITNASTCYMSFLSNIDLSTATPIGTLTYNVFYSQKTFQLFSCPNGNTLYFNTCTD